jgi:guanylate kinase
MDNANCKLPNCSIHFTFCILHFAFCNLFPIFRIVSQPSSIGNLIVLSGPSGVGKSTVLRRLLERHAERLRLSVSATTRPPRPGEIGGVDYHFLSDAEFARRREAGEFLECCEVFGRGHWYGTLLEEVRPSEGGEKWVVLDIDVDGAEKVRQRFPDVLTIFLRPSSLEELERRLRARGTESAEAIARRLEVARRELGRADQYRFQVVNDVVDRAVDEITDILTKQGIMG